MRTGELLDRESRHVIRKAVGGWREVDDLTVRDRLGAVNKSLSHLRAQIEQGLKDHRIRRLNGFLDFTDIRFARRLEELRNECVEILNEVLASANMPRMS